MVYAWQDSGITLYSETCPFARALAGASSGMT